MEIKNKKIFAFFLLLIVSLIILGCENTKIDSNDMQIEKEYEGKKVLYIDSYHEGYLWSDGITQGVIETLNDTGVELMIHRMDTKNHGDEEFKKNAGIIAKEVIEKFNPDVVIVSDDNAFKYVVMDYYKDAELPFVFCAVNWDASVYEAPYKNTAGMLEFVLLDKSVNALKQYAKGDKVGFLAADTESEHKNAEYYVKFLNLNLIDTKYSITFEEWKQNFLELQEKSDIIIIGVTAGIEGYNDSQAEKFIMENTDKPIAVEHDWMINLGTISFSKVAQEQGEWSAKTALEILDGKAPSDVPLAKNKEAIVAINLKMAEKLNIAFSPSILKVAEVVYK